MPLRQHLEQLVLAGQQRFGTLSILDVRVRPVPAKQGAGRIAERNGTYQIPAVFAIDAPNASFGFVGLSCGKHPLPRVWRRRNTLETANVDLNFSVGFEPCRGQFHRLFARRSAAFVNATVLETAARPMSGLDGR
jgi:hypothetical protein